MRYYAGIDGGQSSTVAVVGDERGSVLGRGVGGPADEVGQDSSSTRLRDALSGALRAALAAAGLAEQTQLARVVAGISGYEGRVYGKPPALPAQSLTLMHDAPIAHAGAFAGGPGVVVIAGSGSVAYGTNERGAVVQAGGWGYLFGDEGSAFWLAREAIARAMRGEDAGEPDELAMLALQHLQQSSLRSLARAFYGGEIDRAELAKFAPLVLHRAECGDEGAAQLLEGAAAALVRLAMLVVTRLGMSEGADVAFCGGLLQSRALRDAVARSMHDLLPSARHVEPLEEPALGALRLARESAA